MAVVGLHHVAETEEEVCMEEEQPHLVVTTSSPISRPNLTSV